MRASLEGLAVPRRARVPRLMGGLFRWPCQFRVGIRSVQGRYSRI